MTGRDWDMRGARLAGFHFAEWLVINNGRHDNFMDEYEQDAGHAWAAAQANGWVRTVRPTTNDACRPGYRGRDPWPMLTEEGHLEVDRVRSLRNNLQARAMACREALLLWLAHEGRESGSAQLMTTRDGWRFYDTPFTVAEANEAARFLHKAGLVSGWEYSDGTFMTPRLTTDGTRCVDFFHANVREFLNPPMTGGSVTYNQNINAPVRGQVGQGQNVTFTQNQGVDADSLAAIFKAMRDALPSIEDADDREDVSDAIRELEVAVDDQDGEEIAKKAGRLKRLGSRIGSTAVATATTIGTADLLQALGLGAG